MIASKGKASFWLLALRNMKYPKQFNNKTRSNCNAINSKVFFSSCNPDFIPIWRSKFRFYPRYRDSSNYIIHLKWKRRLRAFQICRSRLFIRTRRRDMAILLQQRGQRRWRLAIVPELRRIGPSSRHHWNQRGRFGLPATFQRAQFWSASSSAAAGDAEKDGHHYHHCATVIWHDF